LTKSCEQLFNVSSGKFIGKGCAGQILDVIFLIVDLGSVDVLFHEIFSGLLHRPAAQRREAPAPKAIF